MKTFAVKTASKVLAATHFVGTSIAYKSLELEVSLGQSKSKTTEENNEIMHAIIEHRTKTTDSAYIKMNEFIKKPRVSFKKNNVEPVK